MQLFVLDENPILAASYLCDKHIVKMGLEAVQILSTVATVKFHRKLSYKPTHANHPCVRWASLAYGNWLWIIAHAEAVFQEYTLRFDKIHKSSLVLTNEIIPLGNLGFTKTQLTPFVLAISDLEELCFIEGTVSKYRSYYYTKSKSMQMSWRFPATRPIWMPT